MSIDQPYTADHELVQRFLAARAAGDDVTLDAVVAQVPVDDLPAFFAALEDHLGPGEHEFDVELLHSSLREAGFDAGDAVRLSLLAQGSLGAYLASTLRAEGYDIGGAAAGVVAQLPDLGADASPVVERYLNRILDGRHDVRRITDRALNAVASACGASLAACEQLRDRGVAGPTPGLLAARGNEGAGGTGAAGIADDLVDELFTGRDFD